MERIDGRVALVTGAASGIGLAIAKALLAEGARVALADIDEAELDRAVGALGESALPITLDVTDRDAWAAAQARVEARFGPVDILVNNAGIGPDGYRLDEMSPEGFDRVIRINLTGVFNGVHMFAAGMRARGAGHIVNVASMAGLTASPRLGAYTAAKFGVVGLTEVLRAELAPAGVGASVLCPGLVTTRLAETTLAAGSARKDMPTSLSGSGIDPSHVGAAVVAAIRADRLYIVTHGEYRDTVAGRMAAMVGAFDGVAKSARQTA